MILLNPTCQLYDAERTPPAPCPQVVLQAADGCLLEGLTNNFFVVMERTCDANDSATGDEQPPCGATEPEAAERPPSASTSQQTTEAAANAAPNAAASAPYDWVVVTAGGTDCILPGLMRARLLDRCRQLGFAVQERPPKLEVCHMWQEAFLTNAVRGIQPVGEVWDASGSGGAEPRLAARLPHGPVTRQLQHWLDDWLEAGGSGGTGVR